MRDWRREKRRENACGHEEANKCWELDRVFLIVHEEAKML